MDKVNFSFCNSWVFCRCTLYCSMPHQSFYRFIAFGVNFKHCQDPVRGSDIVILLLKDHETFPIHVRDVLEHLSERLDKLYRIHKDELIAMSACPSAEYDYSQSIITYQFRTGIFLVLTGKVFETSPLEE